MGAAELECCVSLRCFPVCFNGQSDHTHSACVAVHCSGNVSNALHSNIINLAANDSATTLTDWIVTAFYVCRIANSLFPQLFLNRCSFALTLDSTRYHKMAVRGAAEKINFTEINCWISGIYSKRFVSHTHAHTHTVFAFCMRPSAICGQPGDY